jgi:hypothetical protein
MATATGSVIPSKQAQHRENLACTLRIKTELFLELLSHVLHPFVAEP